MALVTVGAVVVNFGHLAQVLHVDAERGLLLKGLAGQGFGRGQERWFADPAKCTPAPAAMQRPLRLTARDRATVSRLAAPVAR